MYKIFKTPLIITVVALLLALVFGGLQVALILLILAILEISLSFDNAVVNATVLKKMNPYWQKIFLTIGILIAVFGMRLLFPVIVVSIAAHIGVFETIALALSSPLQYAHHLEGAHSTISAFGGAFLAMIFLDWVFEDREIKWLKGLEDLLAQVGKVNQLSTIVMSIAILCFAHTVPLLVAGFAGLITYLIVSAISELFSEDGPKLVSAGFISFLYLELMDASFSFDGVNAAFAVSSNIILIAIGLGIGALFIRTLTVYLVNQGTLNEYIYLEHGAHWAIGILALLLFAGIFIQVPEIVTGLLGVLFIGAAFTQSLLEKRQLKSP